tara:strand:+ start:191 stop:328 length:138 start_codon:yes stop_codon:yes gene_type:complete
MHGHQSEESRRLLSETVEALNIRARRQTIQLLRATEKGIEDKEND